MISWTHNSIKKYSKSFTEIFTINHIFDAWRNFRKGKGKKIDVIDFGQDAYSKIYRIYEDIINDKYIHGGYYYFIVHDPKRREIHKASVRDRIIHQLIYDQFYQYFSGYFIQDSYSSQKGKGTHAALKKYRKYYFQCSKNNRKTAWILKCDIRKCFHSINQDILLQILSQYISCQKTFKMFENIIKSRPQGIPLGNLTSQLFINIYLNELDRYIKEDLQEKYYIRYADDFLIMANDKNHLENILQKIRSFLTEKLKLDLSDHKISIKTTTSGIDFLGWNIFLNHKTLRRKTKIRMLDRVNKRNLPSYLGLLKHGNAYKLANKIERYVYSRYL